MAAEFKPEVALFRAFSSCIDLSGGMAFKGSLAYNRLLVSRVQVATKLHHSRPGAAISAP